jgi:hypothetical protein
MLWLLADSALSGYVGGSGTVGRPWPGRGQVPRVERERLLVRRHQVVKAEREVSYAVTALGPTEADAAAVLALLRGHWGIENRVHWVRNASFDEDRCQVRTQAAPHVLAAGRNLALTLLRRAGHANVAAALRSLAAQPARAVQLVLSGRYV